MQDGGDVVTKTTFDNSDMEKTKINYQMRTESQINVLVHKDASCALVLRFSFIKTYCVNDRLVWFEADFIKRL